MPVYGPQRVATLLAGVRRRYAGVLARPVRLAGGDGFVLELHAAVIGVLGLELVDGRITELNLLVNPAKLTRIARYWHDVRH